MAIQTFEDLNSWQACRDLAKLVYISTEEFPTNEKYGLTSQIRRAAISSAANIAEGFGRTTSKDQEHFYVQALGSLTELRSHFLIAKDIGLISNTSKVLAAQEKAEKLLRGLLRSHRSIQKSKIENLKSTP